MEVLPEKGLQRWDLLMKCNWSKVYVHYKISFYSFFIPPSSLWVATVLKLEFEFYVAALDVKMLYWREIINHAKLRGWLLLYTNIW